MTIRLPALRDRPTHRGRLLLPALALALAGAPAHASLADQVHWTIMGQTAITMDWRGGSDTLFYGQTPLYGSFVVASPPSVTPFSSPGPFREASLTGLAENTIYLYKIGAQGPAGFFRTPPPRGSTGFRFVVQGDIGSSLTYSRVAPTQSLIAEAAPRFVLMAGDLTYANSLNNLEAVDRHFNDMMAWSRSAAYMPVWGNHEYETPSVDDLANYKGRFALPNQQASPGAPASGCCGEDWSWFDYGNVRFISIPEPHPGAWVDWASKVAPIMDDAQADPNIRFIVTFGHRPSFSSGDHGGESTIKTKVAALAATHSKYVLNLAGHDHNYERSHSQGGVVHITAGTGGSPLAAASGSCKWTSGCPAPVWSAYRAMHHVVVILDVRANSIQGTVLCGPPDATRNDVTCTQGTVLDQFVVPGPDQPPQMTAPATAAGSQGSQITVNVQAVDPNGDAISSLVAESLPPGAVFTPAGNKLSGTLTWTPGTGSVGTHVVVFRAANALQDTAQTTIEVSPGNQVPTAALTLNPSTGNDPLVVTANAAASSDPDGQETWYQFDFGDGSIVGPQSSPLASHTFVTGEYDVRLTAIDADGLTAEATAHVIVAAVPPGPNLAMNPSFETSTSGWTAYNGSGVALVSGGFDGNQACAATSGQASGSFGLNDSPNWVTSAGPAGSRYRFTAWVRSPTATGQSKLRITEYQGTTKVGATMFSDPVTLSPTWKQVSYDFLTGASGSTLDLQIVDYPTVPGETFVVDNVSVRDITGIPVGVGGETIAEARSWVTPMPITGGGQLRFVTPRRGPVVVEIFDLSGRRVSTPLDAPLLESGPHEVSLDGEAQRLRAGLYLYRIRFESGSIEGRFVIAR